MKEYERLLELEDEMENLDALQAARETKAAIERGEEEVIPWEQAVRGIREGKVPGDQHVPCGRSCPQGAKANIPATDKRSRPRRRNHPGSQSGSPSAGMPQAQRAG